MRHDLEVKGDYEFHLEPFGQNPSLWNLYTQLTFCYGLTNRVSQQSIIEVLQGGLERLTADFPWIAGQVVLQNDHDGSGRDYYLVHPLEESPRLIVKDLSADLPTWDEYQQSEFPIAFLDEDIVAPRNTKSTVTISDPKPVLLLQASFIDGGVLITFAAQHGTLDIVGQGEMIRLLSKACHGIPFREDELELGNRDRRTFVPLLKEFNKNHPDDNTERRTDQIPRLPFTVGTTTSKKKDVWANFILSTPSLKALKALATQSLPPTTPFTSTDDSLSAFIWQRISHARLPSHAPSSTSTFARTVDPRHHLNIPPTYPGNLATKVYTTFTFEQLTTDSLGTTSAALRHSIDPRVVDIGHQLRAAATALIYPEFVSIIADDKPSRDLARDIALSSWAKLTYCHDLDFNLGLGRPAAVRKPSFASPGQSGMEGVVYLLPKGLDGDIVVTMCLREEEMTRLREDEVWSGFARYIG